MSVRIIQGDCRDVLRTLPDESVHCVVTSPPYFGLRDYGADGQIGLEPTPNEFVAELVAVFSEVRRVLRADGTVWLNLGDSYARDPGKGQHKPGDAGKQNYIIERGNGRSASTVQIRKFRPGAGRADGVVDNRGQRNRDGVGPVPGLKAKDLIGIPWRVAFALQDDGWWLRQDVIWHKPNPMPESVTDRCTKAHEYIFLLSKAERYYFDAVAIAEPAECERLRGSGPMVQPGTGRNDTGSNGDYRKTRSARDSFKREGSKREAAIPGQSVGTHRADRAESKWDTTTRNKRSVWTVPTQPFSEAHFATFPPALIEPCILAGCPLGGTVLDPFGGAGTTGLVADRLGRDAVLIELNADYADMARRRISGDCPMFAQVSA